MTTSMTMKTSKLPPAAALAFALALALAPAATRAAGFVYEGRLDDLGQPANGRYDLRLTAFADAVYGATLAAPIVFEDVPVVDGRFRIDFELPLASASAAWIEVGVRDGAAAGAFSTIPGRSEAASATLIGACWSSTGDSATNPATNFIGTTDAQPFVVRTQNVRSLRIEPSTVLISGNPITTNTISGSSANSVLLGVRGATIAGGGVPSGSSDPDFLADSPNRVLDHYGVVGGGYGNTAGSNVVALVNDQPFATVGGGLGNDADDAYSTVGGGYENRAWGGRSTVAGGESNSASGNYSSIGGGFDNIASDDRSTVGGGESNNASGPFSSIAGGFDNLATNEHSTIGGGSGNFSTGIRSTVGGGFENRASAERSTVGGGALNVASGVTGTISGGRQNTASGVSSTVVGGSDSTASGSFSTVGGGADNCAGGSWSHAAGRSAKVRPGADSGSPSFGCSGVAIAGDVNGDRGTFAWADAQSADFVSTGANQFLVRAAGGLYFGSNSTVSIPAGRFINTSSGAHLTTGGTWTNASSRALKAGFAAIDPLEVLARVTALPITRWTYRGSEEGTHIGPVAEDFKAAFDLAGDGTSIATVDADGVALAAIQGLNRKLESENAELRARLDRIEALLAQSHDAER